MPSILVSQRPTSTGTEGRRPSSRVLRRSSATRYSPLTGRPVASSIVRAPKSVERRDVTENYVPRLVPDPTDVREPAGGHQIHRGAEGPGGVLRAAVLERW